MYEAREETTAAVHASFVCADGKSPGSEPSCDRRSPERALSTWFGVSGGRVLEAEKYRDQQRTQLISSAATTRDSPVSPRHGRVAQITVLSHSKSISAATKHVLKLHANSTVLDLCLAYMEAVQASGGSLLIETAAGHTTAFAMYSTRKMEDGTPINIYHQMSAHLASMLWNRDGNTQRATLHVFPARNPAHWDALQGNMNCLSQKVLGAIRASSFEHYAEVVGPRAASSASSASTTADGRRGGRAASTPRHEDESLDPIFRTITSSGQTAPATTQRPTSAMILSDVAPARQSISSCDTPNPAEEMSPHKALASARGIAPGLAEAISRNSKFRLPVHPLEKYEGPRESDLHTAQRKVPLPTHAQHRYSAPRPKSLEDVDELGLREASWRTKFDLFTL